MKPGPSLACFKLHTRIKIDAEPRETIDWLTDIVKEEGWICNCGSVREQAELWDKPFQKHLRAHLSDFARLGRFSSFDFNSSAENQIQGAAFIEPTDSERLKEEKKLRRRFDVYVKTLGEMNPRDLELLCAGLLSLIKANSPQVTRYTADRGVDFFGKVHFDQHISSDDFFASWHKQLNAWIIGQAKHYIDGTVSTPALRDLAGTVTLLKGPLADRRQYPTLILRACEPVFHLLVTTGRLSNEVWKEIERSGAIGIDGEMLASYLASREIGYSNGAFDPIAFRNWLDQFSSLQNIEIGNTDGDDEPGDTSPPGGGGWPQSQ
jgi:hypothetical protein